ncbi:KH domain-containing protein HEN4-like isoform X2 [Punica granatum]|uniref:KH domain-containing protein HEN4-like isoform X2 n=1 Tax=Punica granatum TaxID=22663 RepID=A0A218XRY7_PUNGR|nr:KH domain-containing protein HEN4-like isoform X2 [Punica granatum]OWM87723.1 hypothetical protein CDL15_Pgr016419 [Punica granatum]
MGSSFLSPPAKRPISYIIPSLMSDPNSSSNGSSSFPSPSKRSKPPQQPLHVPQGHVAFRLLCHASRVGGVIGKSGAIIKSLQQSTGAKIRIEDAPPESPDRIVTVMAPAAISSVISLSSGNPVEQSWEIGGEIEVSKAQEALLRVFERILEVAAETDGPAVGVGVVSCRVLAEKSQAGSVIGKGGKVVEQIRKESGCRIRVLVDKLPACANPGEEMIEIEGDVQGVKKALILIARRLQECPSSDKTRTLSSDKTVEAVPNQSLTDFYVDPPQRNPPLPAMTSISNSYNSGFDHLPYEVAQVTPAEVVSPRQEVSFKILCSVDKAGGVIGRGGTIIKALQNETGALISVGPIVPGCDERLITVTASENPGSRFSPAQKAVVLVFSRSVEVGSTKGQDLGFSKDNSVIARLIVPSNQVGCLLGKGGSIASEIRRVTGAGIRVMKGDQVPKCASANDQVVQISGDFPLVQDALYNVTGRLRDNMLPSSPLSATVSRSSSSLLAETSPYGRIKDPASMGLDSLGLSPSYSRQSVATQSSTDHLGVMHNIHNSASPRLWESQGVAGVSHRGVADIGRGLTSLRSGPEFSRIKSAIVTNTTVEIAVPEEVIHCVYGENSRNLARLREISGAKVTIHDPLPGKSERTVVISGTPDETQAAQSLLHAFILTGS